MNNDIIPAIYKQLRMHQPKQMLSIICSKQECFFDKVTAVSILIYLYYQYQFWQNIAVKHIIGAARVKPYLRANSLDVTQQLKIFCGCVYSIQPQLAYDLKLSLINLY